MMEESTYPVEVNSLVFKIVVLKTVGNWIFIVSIYYHYKNIYVYKVLSVWSKLYTQFSLLVNFLYVM